MPSFDIVSEVDNQEIDNALNQARKELVTRFDLKDAKTEIVQEKEKIVLTADGKAILALGESCGMIDRIIEGTALPT